MPAPESFSPRHGFKNRSDIAIRTVGLNVWYGTFQALFDIDLNIPRGRVTSLIGPSGCGKSTLLRCFNRINERLGYVRTEGSITLLDHDIFAPGISLAQLRKQVGMVPVSIRKNVLFGLHLHHEGSAPPSRGARDQIVEKALREVLLWDAVKDRLDQKATALSLEEQQKLCIARLLSVKPSILLMDEPCSALDPAGTEAVEELIWTLRGAYTIVIVTHNMAQARRASEECAFMLMGKMIEHTRTRDMFVTPQRKETADYIEGRYG